MEYVEEILKAAVTLHGGEEEGLYGMCRCSESELLGRLKDGVTVEDCREVFIVAAAMLALDFLDKARGGVTAFKAGDVSVEMKAEKADLRLRAEAMLGSYLEDGGFSFVGVPG